VTRDDYERRRDELRREIDIVLDQAERGEMRDAEEVFARILEKNKRAHINRDERGRAHARLLCSFLLSLLFSEPSLSHSRS